MSSHTHSPTHTKNQKNRGRGDEEDDDEDEVVQWNLRKCSAAGLDVLSTVFGDELLPIVLPIVQARMQDADWRARESATLALGAISEGCAQGLLPYLSVCVCVGGGGHVWMCVDMHAHGCVWWWVCMVVGVYCPGCCLVHPIHMTCESTHTHTHTHYYYYRIW